jgi:MFS family permease
MENKIQEREIKEETKKEAKINEESLKEKAKKISILEGSAYSVHDGFGLRNITPYALAIGKNNPHINAYIGFLSSIPSLIGNISQLYSAKAIERFPRKKIVLKAVWLQAFMWLAIISIGILFFIFHIRSTTALIFLVIFYTLLVLFGAFAGPAWASWMKDLVTKDSGKYFGRRNRICGFIALVSLLAAGFILDYFKAINLFFGFIILFFFAFVFRSVSGFLFTKKYEPHLRLEKGYYFSLRQFITRMPHNNFGRFTIFLSLISLSTAIASPFFSVYMLSNLKLSYLQWTTIIISSSLFSLLFMPLWGKFSDKYGNLKTMKISGGLVFLVPILWLISPILTGSLLFIYLISIEALSGAIWAGFNLASANFIYDAVTRQRMAICSAYMNIINGTGVFIGATLGGIISSLNFKIFGIGPLLFIFLLSGIARLVVYVIMAPAIKEVRPVKNFNLKKSAKERLKFLNKKSMLDLFELRAIKPRPDED